MAPHTRRRHYACLVILVDASSRRPEYVRHATLLHRSTVGNSVMDCIDYLNNAIFVPSCLEHLVASINVYHETCPDCPFRWKNMFLICIVDEKNSLFEACWRCHYDNMVLVLAQAQRRSYEQYWFHKKLEGGKKEINRKIYSAQRDWVD